MATSVYGPMAGVEEPQTLTDELVSFLAPSSVEADQYRTLRLMVERLSRDSALKVIAITSPAPGDGKTVTTLNLAGSLAQTASAKVLVVDGDLHQPSIATRLGLSPDAVCGIEDVLLDDTKCVATAARRLKHLNLSVLPALGTHPRPYELMASARLGAILADARANYDFVLVDTPPAVPLADCRMLGGWVDGFIVVVGAHRTPREMLAETVRALDPDKLVGVVFNGDDQPLPAYYGYYYGTTRRGYGLPPMGRSWWTRLVKRAD